MNRREFFRMIFGAGVACVLPKMVEVVPEVTGRDIVEKLTELRDTTQEFTWATEQIAINPMTDEQLERLRKRFAESDCVGEVRIVPKCDSRVDWNDGHHPDLSLYRNDNGTFPGIDVFLTDN